jgi:Polyketide cyclase / dehydrase and lipid transport
MIIARTVTVDRPAGVVFDYVSDFTTTTEWDPGTVDTVRVDGDGGVGTTYRNTSRFLGRTTELTYVVIERSPGQCIRLRGENATVVALDAMTLRQPRTGTTELTYRAEFTFKGPWRLLAPLLAPAFRRLGDQAEAGLRRALNALPTP